MNVRFNPELNRYYDYDAKKIVNKKVGKQWVVDHLAKMINDEASQSAHTSTHSHKRKKRPSYKSLYLAEKVKNEQMHKELNGNHSFIINQTRNDTVSPTKLVDKVHDWEKSHYGKLFIISELGSDGDSITKACGTADKFEAAGYLHVLAKRVNEIFGSDYND